MERIAIFSDIHGNEEALNGILEDIKKEQIKDIICLGDVIGIGPNPKEALQLIKNNNIEMLLGNHEIYFLNQFRKNEIFDVGSKHTELHQWTASQLDDSDIEFLKKCKLYKKEKYSNCNIKFNHFFIKENIEEGRYPFYEIDIRKEENQNDERINGNEEYNFFGHIHKKCFFEKDEKKYYCIGSSGCVNSNITFYTIVSIENGDISLNYKEIQFNRKLFDEKMKCKMYPEKEEVYKRFFS